MTDTSQGENVAQCGVYAAITAHRDSLNDPDSDVIRDALTRSCDVCGAAKRVMCVERPDLPEGLAGRRVHFGRLTPRGRAK